MDGIGGDMSEPIPASGYIRKMANDFPIL